MDYGKSGAPKSGSKLPRFDKHKEAPKGKAARGGKASKDELLARLKAAAAEAKKAD